MPNRAWVVPVGRVLQMSPFVEVWIVPRDPTPTKRPPPKARAVRLLAVPEADEGAQFMASAEVTTLVPPAATNIPLPKATADKGGVVCGLWSSHAMPSVEVTILPAFCEVVLLV